MQRIIILAALVVLTACNAESIPQEPPASGKNILPSSTSQPLPTVTAMASHAVLQPTFAIPTIALSATPSTSPTHPPTVPPVTPSTRSNSSTTLELTPPLIVDSKMGRLYLSGLVNGVWQIVALAATDGRLLATFNITGEIAVDSTHGWLYVDRNESGLTVLNTQTGARHVTIPLPGGRHGAPAPLADQDTGQVFVFRDNVVYVIDPKQGIVVSSIPFNIAKDNDCRNPIGPLPIEWAKYDTVRHILYLDFVTWVCTPHIGHTIVSYDLNTHVEIARESVSSSPKVTARDGYLYGSSCGHTYAGCMGIRWVWRDGRPWFTSALWGDYYGVDLVVDSARGRVYESHDDLWVLDAKTMALLLKVPQPVQGRLVGYDPKTDQLYFLSEGRLKTWSASAIQPPSPKPLLSSQPPAKPIWRLWISPAWPQDKTLLGLWDYAWSDCYSFGPEGGQLYVSADGGSTWGRPQGGLRDCTRILSLAISPSYARDRTIFAGILWTGILRSKDGGRLWLPSNAGLSGMDVQQILFSPNFEHDQTAYTLAGSRIHRSTDGGASWQEIGADLGCVRSVALSPEFDQDRAMMSISCNNKVFLSRDRGTTWQQTGEMPGRDSSSNVDLLSMAPLFSKWQVVFAHWKGNLYHSADAGRSWNAVLKSKGDVQLAYGPETEKGRLLFLLTTNVDKDTNPPLMKNALYRSEDAVNWKPVSMPFDVSPTAIAISPNFAQDGLLFIGTADGRVMTWQAAKLTDK